MGIVVAVAPPAHALHGPVPGGVAKRNASALNVSTYLRRLSGVISRFFAVMTAVVYVLLLSGLARPPQCSPRAGWPTSPGTNPRRPLLTKRQRRRQQGLRPRRGDKPPVPPVGGQIAATGPDTAGLGFNGRWSQTREAFWTP